jgi:hypothetical protein
MGGRDSGSASGIRDDKKEWVEEVSDERLLAYRRMIISAGRFSRVSGEERTADQRTYMADVISTEISRRGIEI